MSFTLPKACRIDGVVAKQNSRHVTTGVLINAERKSLMATDGRIALELPIADMNDETTAVVPVEAFKALRRRKGRLWSRGKVMICDGTHATISGSGTTEQFDVDTESRFPNMAGILDGHTDHDDDVVLGINAKLLAALAAGMGTDAVKLRIRSHKPNECVSNSVCVTPLNHAEAPIPTARGAIMPIRVNREDKERA